jgi:PhoD-like phosphatase
VVKKGQQDDDPTAKMALQVLLLDVRYHSTPDDLLGEKQWQWLSDQLQQEDVTLRVIVSPIQILPTIHDWECWYRIPESRRRLLDMITESPFKCTTILLSGDRHVAAMYQYGDNLLEVTSSSGGTRPASMMNSIHNISWNRSYSKTSMGSCRLIGPVAKRIYRSNRWSRGKSCNAVSYPFEFMFLFVCLFVCLWTDQHA